MGVKLKSLIPREKGAEENIWTQEGESGEGLEKTA
jgi:hypothetical protein